MIEKSKPAKMKAEHRAILALSERLIKAQKPIRVLDSIKWGPEIEHAFFHHRCEKQPEITADYYKKHPLKFDPEDKRDEFYSIEREIKRSLGQFSGVGNIMLRMCREYRMVVRMLEARGTPEFSDISKELYGSSMDLFYAGGPTLSDLGNILSIALSNLDEITNSPMDEKRYNANEAVEELRKRFNNYFYDDVGSIKVVLSDGIISDAAAGADTLKIHRDRTFSERDLNILEVHEGWVHIGTTLNGLQQPICTFLSKGPPSSTVFQEGLAVIMEIFTFSSHPNRIRRLTHRIIGSSLAEQGGTFLDIYRHFIDQGLSPHDSYTSTSRIFRGSAPTLGPFTKDLSYNKGFIIIYNYIRLAIQYGHLKKIPLLFLGKTSIEDLKIYEFLIEEGIVTYPKYIPKQFQDIGALASWMSYSLFLNKIDLDKLAKNFRTIL